jgi:hypothetical protein
MDTIKIELTIKKSAWLSEDALINRIKKELEWALATGGCELVDAKIVLPWQCNSHNPNEAPFPDSLVVPTGS